MCRAIPRWGTWAALTRQRGVESVHLHGHSVARGRLCRPAKTWWRPNTWTGYTDKELLEQVGAGSWYDIYYRYLSSGVHVDATTISEDLHALAHGRAEVGPRYRYAFGVLRVTVEVLHVCMLAFHKLVAVGDLKVTDQAETVINRVL